MALNNNRSCVWFDLDDTLITTSKSLVAAVNASTTFLRTIFPALTEIDVARQSMDVWLTELGPGTPGFSNLRHMDLHAFRTCIVQGTLQRLNLAGINAQDLLQHSASAEENAWVCYPGVTEVLDSMVQDGIPIGLISNGPTALQNRKLVSTGLIKYFERIVLDCEVGISKPDAKIFQLAAECMPNCNHVMVGNDPDADIDGALRANWTAIWFKPGWDGETKPSEMGYIPIHHHREIYGHLTKG